MEISKLFIVPYIISLLVGCSSPIERVYYIPEVEVYVKTIVNKGENSGYILFSNSNNNMNLSKDIDYVRSSTLLSSIFVLQTGNNIGIRYNGNLLEVNPVNYNFINIEETDSVFYEKRFRTNPLIIKDSYIEFVVTDYFNMALIKTSGEKSYTKIEPIK